MDSSWNPSRVEQKIGLNFKHQETLRLALIHPSYAKLIQEPEINNQRLELLGLTILNLAITDYIYWNFSHFSPSKQKALREKLTESERLTKFWYDLGLGEAYPFLGLKEERHRLRVKSSNPFEQGFKALVGAIFLDRGFSQTRNWLQKHLLKPTLQRYLKPELPHSPDSKHEQILGDALLQAVTEDYLYRQVLLAKASVLKTLARKLTSQERQKAYFQQTKIVWDDLFPGKTPAKSCKQTLSQIYLLAEQQNNKTSYRQVGSFFSEYCLDEDEIMRQAIELLLKEGKPQKWIIHKMMGYPSNKYHQGRERYYELLGIEQPT